MSKFCRRLPSRLLTLLLTILSAQAAFAHSPERPQPRTMALLIGVDNYNRVGDLDYCSGDVELVSETLQDYCNCPRPLRMTDEAKTPTHLRPTKGNIIAELNRQLRMAVAAKCDRFFLYFAGHGVVGKDGQLYLAPQDLTNFDVAESGLSVSYVRKILSKHKGVTTKYLILDACHSANTRNMTDASAAAIGRRFKQTPGLFTLAACQANEKSVEWGEVGHGVFTYFFCQGLKGAADLSPYGNANGIVDTDELTAYVRTEVPAIANKLNESQLPVGIPSDDWSGPSDLAYTTATVSQQTSSPPPLDPQLQLGLALAEKYRNGDGNLGYAIDQVSSLLERKPNHPQLLAARGQYLLERGTQFGSKTDLAAAERDLCRAIEADKAPPRRLAVYLMLRGEIRWRAGNLAMALKDASSVIDLQPTTVAYINRSLLHRQLGDVELADKDQSKAWELKQP